MELHESLAALAQDHGESLFAEADAFRGALDDYLDEGSASTGTINLLTDAVRLGALQAMLTMLDSGAGVDDAVESAGLRLSRDRGSADVTGSQWACAVLGYALGRVPVELATRLRPDAFTAHPPNDGGATAPRPPVVSPPSVASQPTSLAGPGSVPGATQAPQHSPAQQWPAPAQQAHPASAVPQHQPTGQPGQQAQPASGYPSQPGPSSPSYAYAATPAYNAGPPRKSSSGLIIGAIVAVVILGVIAIVGIIALTGDDSPSANDTASDGGDGGDGGDDPSIDPALTQQGDGYTYQRPTDEWQDLTSGTEDTTGTIDSISAPGDSITTARGNVLVEKSSAFGETEVTNLASQWKTVLQGSTGATATDIEDRQIGGKDAVGVELLWTNDNGFAVHQIAYLVVSGDDQYSITGSFKQGDDGFKDLYYQILDSWSWED
ncbi:hypothetical protein [Nocardioides stalactiti]|uniref:hypothetical protein n=1 Tax=Nocardioides stalactiti TaxID=2755356 RepID=UPI0016023460|nr:hypothetical protein [Nocardioides stalactiti]